MTQDIRPSDQLSRVSTQVEQPAPPYVDAPPPPPAPGGGGYGRGGRGGGGGRRRYLARDLTQGSIPKNLAFLAWPQIVEGLLNVFDQMWHLFLAGQGFGYHAIAGIGTAQQVVQLMRTGRMGLDTAMRAMIARAIGANDVALARHIAWQAFTVNAVLALFVTAIGVLFTEVILRTLGISNEVIAQAAGYMRWQFIGTIALTGRMAMGAALQAGGDAVTPMKATTTARIIDIALSPILMFGWLGTPEFGVAGVAVANLIGQGIGALFNLEALATGRGNSRLHLSLRDYRFDPRLSWRLVRLGLPATVNSIERSAAQVILLGLMSPFGDVALAAYALTQRAQIAVNLGTQGLGNAAGIIAGQNLGAANVSRAKLTVRWALGYVFVVKLIVVATLWAFPTLFLGIFNDDPQLLSEGSTWLRILLIGYLAQGPVQVLMQSFQVAGDTVMPMFTTLLAMWVIEVPLAIMLTGAADLVHPFGLTLPFPTIGSLGAYGIAVSIVAADFTRLSIYLPYFQWGPWYKKRILEGVRGGGPEAVDAPIRGGH